MRNNSDMKSLKDEFLEVMKNEESIIGLVIGFLIALLVSYFLISKIRKYQIKNLEFLKGLYGHLCKLD